MSNLRTGLIAGLGALALSGAHDSALPKMMPVKPLPHVSPVIQKPKVKVWSDLTLHPELKAISFLESRGDHSAIHHPSSKGAFHTAFGALGFKPVTAHWEYTKNKKLQAKWPALSNPDSFVQKFQQDPDFYNDIASSHWNRLKSRLKNDASRAAYAWRFGLHKALNTPDDSIHANGYINGFNARLREEPINKVDDNDLHARARRLNLLYRRGELTPEEWYAANQHLMALGTADKRIADSKTESRQLPKMKWRAPDGIKSIRDVPAGKDGERVDNQFDPHVDYDYSHVLTPEQQKAGFKMTLKDFVQGNKTTLNEMNQSENYRTPVHFQVDIKHPTRGHVGAVLSQRFRRDMLNSIEPHSHIDADFRDKGLGMAGYVALYTHALKHHGITQINGGRHTEGAANVHSKLANTFGLAYRRRPISEAGNTPEARANPKVAGTIKHTMSVISHWDKTKQTPRDKPIVQTIVNHTPNEPYKPTQIHAPYDYNIGKPVAPPKTRLNLLKTESVLNAWDKNAYSEENGLISSGSVVHPSTHMKPNTLYSKGSHWPLLAKRILPSGKEIAVFNSRRMPDSVDHTKLVNQMADNDTIRVDGPEWVHADWNNLKRHLEEKVAHSKNPQLIQHHLSLIS